jgi:hypothetical protein
LRAALERATPNPIAASLREQLIGTVQNWFKFRSAGYQAIHPGNSNFAKWGKCRERQARENLRTLERWRALEAVEYQKGGRRATRYIISGEGIFRALVNLGCNPHPNLRKGLKAYDLPIGGAKSNGNPTLRLVKNPALNPAVSAAGIQSYITEVPQEAEVTPVPSSTGRHPSGCLHAFSDKICKESGGRKLGERSAKQRDPIFSAFWRAYPKKRREKQTRAAFKKALNAGVSSSVLVDMAKRYAISVEGEDPKWVSCPATWLNDQRWLDEDLPPLKDPSDPSQQPVHHTVWMNMFR